MKDTVVMASYEPRDKKIIDKLTDKKRLLQVIKTDSAIEIPQDAQHIVCDAPLTQLARHLENRNTPIKNVIILGGFVGCNILKRNALCDGLKTLTKVKDINLSADIESSLKVFKTTAEQITDLWMLSHNLEDKRSDDAAEEIINIISGSNKQDLNFKYLDVNPEHNEEIDIWGSTLYLLFKQGRTRSVHATIGVK